jgi:hypothetical protein
MAHAGERERVVPHGADHVLRLPEFPPQDARSGVERIKPRKSDKVFGRGSWKLPKRVCFARNQLELRSEWAELAFLHKREIHLQCARKEEHAIGPRTEADVVVVEHASACVQEIREIRHHGSDKRRIGHAKSKIDIRPLVLVAGHSRSGDRRSAEPRVARRKIQQVRFHLSTMLRREARHRTKGSSDSAALSATRRRATRQQ